MTKRLVLIADDLKLFLAIERTLLEKGGLDVVTAETGDEAIDRARRRPPNLVLLDLEMPGRDGADTCAAMRRDPALASTPIIIMTARGSNSARERCLEAGCTEFVVKPEHPKELLGLVARVLAARRRKAAWISVVFSIHGNPGGRQFVGRAADLSATGLLLVTSKHLEVDNVIEVEFVVPKNHQTVRTRGRITRARPTAIGTVETGVHFLDIGPGDQEAILEYVAG
jgi:CheY-like chemotaxis protein